MIMLSAIDLADHLQRARELRILARTQSDPHDRRILLEIADRHDRMVRPATVAGGYAD